MNLANPAKQYVPRPMRASDCANLKRSDLGQGSWQVHTPSRFQDFSFSGILENRTT
jgi:hypothetical protein